MLSMSVMILYSTDSQNQQSEHVSSTKCFSPNFSNNVISIATQTPTLKIQAKAELIKNKV